MSLLALLINIVKMLITQVLISHKLSWITLYHHLHVQQETWAWVCVSILILSCEKKWLVCRQLELFKLIPLPTPVFPSHPSVSLPRLSYMQTWNSVFITLCLAPMRVLLMRAPLWRPAQLCVRGLDNLCFPFSSTNCFFSTDPPPGVCSSSKENRSW